MATHSSTFALKIPWMEELEAGYYPWGRKELGTTERLHFYPLQYSGLENSMDCIVHRVAKTRTRLSDFPFHLS